MKKLLGLSGKMASGKSTICKFLQEKYGYRLISVGTPMKKIGFAIVENRLNEAQKTLEDILQDPFLAKKTLELYLQMFEVNFKNNPSVVWEKNSSGEYLKNDSYRSLLQNIAGIMRHEIDELAWIRYAARVAKEWSEKGQRVVCDDLRVPVEVEVFSSYGFTFVRLDITLEEQKKRIFSLYGEVDEERLVDETEIALDDTQFPLHVDATQSIEEVERKIVNFLMNK